MGCEEVVVKVVVPPGVKVMVVTCGGEAKAEPAAPAGAEPAADAGKDKPGGQ